MDTLTALAEYRLLLDAGSKQIPQHILEALGISNDDVERDIAAIRALHAHIKSMPLKLEMDRWNQNVAEAERKYEKAKEAIERAEAAMNIAMGERQIGLHARKCSLAKTVDLQRQFPRVIQ